MSLIEDKIISLGVHKKSKNTLIVVSHDESISKYFDEVIRFENLLEGSE